jgi:hypothetical protein
VTPLTITILSIGFIGGVVACLAAFRIDQARQDKHHRYLATSCLHGDHDYCAAKMGAVGEKKPSQCKFCAAPCICDCHR